MERIIFYVLALTIIAFAVASVNSRKMLRSVIYLAFVLISIAGIFFLVDYNLLAAIQLTVYAGGIIVLIIFSVLLVHHIEMRLEMASMAKRITTAVLCLVGIGVFTYTIHSFDFKVVPNSESTTTEAIGNHLLSYGDGGFILPFEVISILLLAAMIGAIVIAKGKKLMDKNNEPI
jgi:NADH-quinone oxidoreductase subunit J